MNLKQSVSIITLLGLSSSLLLSCGKDSGSGTAAEDIGSAQTQAVSSDTGYAYPNVNYDGYEFKVLNYAEMWSCNMAVDFDEQTGEALDDAIYNRNRKVEDKLGFEMSEIKIAYPGYSQIAQICDQVSQSVMAGDNSFDAAYLPVSYKTGVITEGSLYNLNSMPELNLDSEWWDKAVNDAMTVNGKLYTASSPLHLMSLDMSWVLLFNQDMMDSQKMEYPYQLVRDGKWTLDKFYEYVASAASLNGDDSFTSYKKTERQFTALPDIRLLHGDFSIRPAINLLNPITASSA